MFKGEYTTIITIENLLATWETFLLGKKRKRDVIKLRKTQSDMVVFEEYGIPRYCLKNCLNEMSIEELIKLREECHELRKSTSYS